MISFVKSVVFTLMISVLGILASLLIVEVSYRAIGLLGSKPLRWSDRPAVYYNPSDSKTLQGDVYNTTKPKGTFRVAVIGDSFTFAPFMQPDDAFPARLERLLEMSGSKEFKKVEVINYGVPGFSTSHEVGATRQAISEGSDFVLLQITLNDAQLKNYQPTGLTGQNQFGAYESPQKYSSLLQYWSSLDYFLERVHNTDTHNRYVQYYYDLFEKEASWNSFNGALKRIARVTKKHDVGVAAVVFPLFGVPLNSSYPFTEIHQKVATALQEKDIPYLDLFQPFQGIPLERLQVIPGGDFHPNEIGHRIASEQIYEWIKKSALIPSSLLQAHRYSTRTDIRLIPSRVIE